MAKYGVSLMTTASFYIEVDAEDEDEAFDLAMDVAPGVNITNEFELDDWMVASDYYKGAIDIEKIGD